MLLYYDIFVTFLTETYIDRKFPINKTLTFLFDKDLMIIKNIHIIMVLKSRLENPLLLTTAPK